MTPRETINLNRFQKANIVISVGSLVLALGMLIMVVRSSAMLEIYLARVVTVDDMRDFLRENERANPPIMFAVSMDEIHARNHDTKLRFK